VLFDPARGVMVVEVKGGDVWCERGEWRQRNRKTGHVDTVFPETQASDTMHRIRCEVAAKVSAASNFLFCHAVWFPDGAVDRAHLPMNYHPDMTFDAEDVGRPEEAIHRAFRYWHSVFPGRIGLTSDVAKLVFDALAPTLSIVRSVRQTLDERQEQLVQLTREQARVIDFLDEQLHAAILGPAGTGKTLLAVEKARRQGSPTEPVLFLCYNAALCEHLAAHHAQPNVRYLTFHGFARELTGSEGTLESAEEALIEHLADDSPIPYQHVIVDEGHDFKREWLEYLQYRFRDGGFYVFYDRHQTIQGDKDTSWIDDIPCRLVLTRNCRNTEPIARVAYRAGGLTVIPTLGLSGPRPVLHATADSTASVNIVTALVDAACINHKRRRKR
jgi:AAA domain